MKRQRRRRDAKSESPVILPKPLHDEVDIEFKVGCPALIVDRPHAKPVDMAIVPGQIIEVGGRPRL
ncbi:MAG: hypothetical protein GC162_15650 [Planctomycetes bacterium]|nr:hypothetical protein [Planctomycetota bacterium]